MLNSLFNQMVENILNTYFDLNGIIKDTILGGLRKSPGKTLVVWLAFTFTVAQNSNFRSFRLKNLF